jgi:DNA modification methylase
MGRLLKKMVSLLLGDCLEKMKEMESNSVDSIVTDPPYGISFMGKKWDYDIPSIEIWKECFRVLKPGGHLLSFGGTRTFHRMAVNIEDAGFEIRDTIMWLYGSGFPKSHNIGKAIDKKLGNEREVVGVNPNHRTSDALYELGFQGGKSDGVMTKGTSEWEGWGTGLKPAVEPIIMARKPFKGTVVSNVLSYGTGALNIDVSRVKTDEDFSSIKPRDITKLNTKRNDETEEEAIIRKKNGNEAVQEALDKLQNLGRWPANVIHDGSEEVVSLFPNTKSGKMTSNHNRHTDGSPNGIYSKFDVNHPLSETYGDEGSAARFFYCAKTSKKDRQEGCEELDDKEIGAKGNGLGRVCETCSASILKPCDCPERSFVNKCVKNHHPTVKPTELMKYLCKLITPLNGIVLDPFMGSGSTGKAALLEGFSFIGIEMDEDYLNIASARLSHILGDKNNE